LASSIGRVVGIPFPSTKGLVSEFNLPDQVQYVVQMRQMIESHLVEEESGCLACAVDQKVDHV